jgi:hypothetical protein
MLGLAIGCVVKRLAALAAFEKTGGKVRRVPREKAGPLDPLDPLDFGKA